MSSRECDVTGLTVLLISDPGLPTRRVQAVREKLRTRLENTYGPATRLVECTAMLRVGTEGNVDFETVEKVSREHPHSEAVLWLTEMPRHSHNHPLIAEVFPDRRLSVVSCPTLGVLSPWRRLIDTFMTCLVRMNLPGRPATNRDPRLQWGTWSEEGTNFALHAHTITGELRIVLGMVSANEPLRTAPRLSGALAAAAAVGAFGLFYNSVWQMSATLSAGRLAFIGVLAIGAMVFWLMLNNRLWDKPLNPTRTSLVLLYNLSTVLTLILCVGSLYLALVVMILVSGLIVINPNFMEQILGTDVGFMQYFDIAWFSAAMGVIAGGLGTSFDSEEDIRRVTHGQRERQRINDPETANP